MKSFLKILGAVVITALVCYAPAVAQQIIEAKQGEPGVKGPWPVTITAGVPAAAPVPTSQLGQTYSPAVPSQCPAAASTSCPLTAFAAAGSCLRIHCLTDCSYRLGAGAQVALATDIPLPAKVIERECMTSGQDSMAFFCAAAGTCSVSVVAKTP